MKKSLRVLLVEDDADDAELLRDSFLNSDIECVMHVINDGSGVMSYLHKCTTYPDIIVMDMNLPKMHGKEILKEIKADEKLRRLPLVILTTSSSAEDKRYMLGLGADDHLTKPTTSAGLYAVVSVIVDVAARYNNRA